jgi:hypothetical protein
MTDAHLPTGPDGQPLTVIEDGDTGDRFLVYTAKDGIRAELRILGDTFWATRAQMAEMFDIDVRTVSYHLTNVFSDGELSADSVSQESWLTASDGKSYRTNLYSLDAMISVGYRVSSRLGTMFRIWATAVLMQYLTKGFVIDDDRLKNPDGKPDFFSELLDRIRDIRSSEKRMWTRILELATFCVDYDPRDPTQHTEFFAEIQNTMHWAVLQKTAPEVVVERVDHRKANAGVMSFKGKMPTVVEAQTAKNLMMEPEVTALNHITSLMLEFFDSQVEQRRQTTLGQFQVKMRDLVKLDGRPLKPLGHTGRVSRQMADQWASKEIGAYKATKRLEAEAAGEEALSKLAATVKRATRRKDSR